jgi:hypothetical protein
MSVALLALSFRIKQSYVDTTQAWGGLGEGTRAREVAQAIHAAGSRKDPGKLNTFQMTAEQRRQLRDEYLDDSQHEHARGQARSGAAALTGVAAGLGGVSTFADALVEGKVGVGKGAVRRGLTAMGIGAAGGAAGGAVLAGMTHNRRKEKAYRPYDNAILRDVSAAAMVGPDGRPVAGPAQTWQSGVVR